jgi:hypothetical protein
MPEILRDQIFVIQNVASAREHTTSRIGFRRGPRCDFYVSDFGVVTIVFFNTSKTAAVS